MAKAAELMALPQVQRRDEAITFAPTHVTSVELLLKGERYFPRILEDIAAARDHIHMLFYAIRPGTIADAVVDALDERARAGLEVKVAVDAIGSGVDSTSRGLYKRMRASGVEVVANDGIAIVRGGRIGNRSIRFHAEDALHFDHRKMMVIDGRVAYVGGTGIEDHFADGRFTDVMCRVTGPIVSQVQLAFLTSWAKDGGPKPPDLVGLFLDDVVTAGPPVADLGVTLLMNVPGTGHHPIREAILESLAAARERIDIVNPYIATPAVIRGFVEAARRGAAVRIVVPADPAAAAAARCVPGLDPGAARGGRDDRPAPGHGPREGLPVRRHPARRELQPRPPVALPQRRARPAVRGCRRAGARRAVLRRAGRGVGAGRAVRARSTGGPGSG